MVESTGSLLERLKQAREGNSSALGLLLDEFRPYLRFLADRAVDRRLSGRVDASDIVQQTYLSAVRKFDEFTGEDADTLVAWLRMIHERNLIDTVRRHLEAEKRSVNRESADVAVEPLQDIEMTSPSQRLMHGENAVRLARELSLLPDEQAEAVRRRYLDGWSLDEIAARMDRSKRAVASLLYRGLENLRERMANREDN
jgi:RNA polymerase sigma-70 factor (ECF subfamily)